MSSIRQKTALTLMFIFVMLSGPSPAVQYGETKPMPMATAHNLDITVNIKERSIDGKDTISIKKGAASVRLLIRAGSSIDRIEMDGKRLDLSVRDLAEEQVKEFMVKLPEARNAAERNLEVYFHGTFPDIEKARENIKRGVAFVEDGVIGPEGVFLPSGSIWYPQEENGLLFFDAAVSLPEGYTSLMEGEWLKNDHEGGRTIERWKTEHPIDGLDLVAGKYVIEKEVYKGINIYTFFFNSDAELSKLYIDKTKGYLDLYQDMIGPYPFKKFAVVENFLPTGYGMPSFTLLGSTVIRLPFIPDTSLGHEIAHNWWGNSVFVDSSHGNWSEAVTTYTADYLYTRNKGEKEARDFRFSKLLGYKNFAGQSSIALKDFIDSTSTASRAVGYNKGSMVFNMLNRLLGSDAFNAGIKEFYRDSAFKKASWADIESAFEKASGKDLKWFFDEWVYRAGGPELSFEDAGVKGSGQGFIVTFRLKQSGKAPYILNLPVLFRTEKGDVWKDVRVDKTVETISIELSSRPLSFEIDPEYETFRILSDEEIPPTFAAFFGDKKGLIVIPNGDKLQEKYQSAADLLADDFNKKVITDADIGKKDYIKDSSLFIFGVENRFFTLVSQYLSKYLSITPDSYVIEGRSYTTDGSVMGLAVKNPDNPATTICFITGSVDKEKMAETGKRMRYFSDSSYIVFTKDGKIEKGTIPGRKVLRHEFK